MKHWTDTREDHREFMRWMTENKNMKKLMREKAKIKTKKRCRLRKFRVVYKYMYCKYNDRPTQRKNLTHLLTIINSYSHNEQHFLATITSA